MPIFNKNVNTDKASKEDEEIKIIGIITTKLLCRKWMAHEVLCYIKYRFQGYRVDCGKNYLFNRGSVLQDLQQCTDLKLYVQIKLF